MYKAIKEIGEYKIGEEIPTDKALAWMDMYAVPHVEEIICDSTDESEDKMAEEPKNSILEDYLARGNNVVKKNVREDKLSDNQLQELLKLEKSNKNRPSVIFAIEKRLAN
jgi:hypothetical protein